MAVLTLLQYECQVLGIDNSVNCPGYTWYCQDCARSSQKVNITCFLIYKSVLYSVWNLYLSAFCLYKRLYPYEMTCFIKPFMSPVHTIAASVPVFIFEILATVNLV